MYKYTVTQKELDPTNGNIVVTAHFEDDAKPGTVHVNKTWAFDLTDARIDEWARQYIDVLTTRDRNFAALTTGAAKTPAPVSPATQAVTDAQIKLSEAMRSAQIKQLNDPDVTAAHAALLAAQEAAKAKRA